MYIVHKNVKQSIAKYVTLGTLQKYFNSDTDRVLDFVEDMKNFMLSIDRYLNACTPCLSVMRKLDYNFESLVGTDRSNNADVIKLWRKINSNDGALEEYIADGAKALKDIRTATNGIEKIVTQVKPLISGLKEDAPESDYSKDNLMKVLDTAYSQFKEAQKALQTTIDKVRPYFESEKEESAILSFLWLAFTQIEACSPWRVISDNYRICQELFK